METNIVKILRYWFPSSVSGEINTALPQYLWKSPLNVRSWKLMAFPQVAIFKFFRNFSGVLIYLGGNWYSSLVHICYGSSLAFLVNLMTVFRYSKCQNDFFLYVILEFRRFCLNSCSQTFKKKQGEANIWDGTNILKSFTCILVLCHCCHWMTNLKITLMCKL